jgi:isochorismate synthase
LKLIQEITVQHKKGLPFVAYRKPGESLVNVLLQQNKEVFFAENFTEKGFAFAPFDLKNPAYLIPLNSADFLTVPFQDNSPGKKNFPENKVHSKEKNRHFQLVEKGIEGIKKGLFQKVVLSRKQEVEVSAENPLQIFENLLKNYPQAFCYCWFHPKTGLWMGATPETLFKVESGFLKTMALAGTQKYQGSLDVSWGEKEKEEQEMVTRFILSELEGKLENPDVSEVETIRAGNLLHLKTRIAGKFSSSSLKEIIRALHPTPAVCGLPKEAAKNFILKNENYDREFYTGFLGELNSGEKTDLYVNLRCMKMEGQKAILYIGGGITKDSRPEAEWEETVNKAGTMLRVLSS